MERSLTKQRQELKRNLTGYLDMVAGKDAKSELDNIEYMETFILPYAPEGVAMTYWIYRSVDFAIEDQKRLKILAKEFELDEYEFA